MIEQLQSDRDAPLAEAMRAKAQTTRTPNGEIDSEALRSVLRHATVSARDNAFGVVVTMNLNGEMTDIVMPPVFSDHDEQLWTKAADSISRTAAALQARAQGIATKAILAATQGGPDAR